MPLLTHSTGAGKLDRLASDYRSGGGKETGAMRSYSAAWACLAGLLAVAASGCGPAELTPDQRAETARLLARWEDDRHGWAVDAASWTMCHCAGKAAGTRYRDVFEAIEEYGRGNERPLASLGGPEGLRRAFRRMLRDPDPIARGFAAVVLAAMGDHISTGAIAEVMRGHGTKPRPPGDGEVDFPGWDRGKAALALGILRAGEYTDEIAAMLAGMEESARCGAALALGLLEARTHADGLADLLDDEEDNPKICAAVALAVVGARDKAGRIAGLLSAGGDPAVAGTACYALARLRASDQADAVAGLLADDYHGGTAAKALALMGRRDRADQIAALLTSRSSLVRRDAALALGILKSTAHEGAVAGLLDDEEAFVRHAAAVGLLLMGSRRALPDMEIAPASDLDEHNFHWLVLADARRLSRLAEVALRARRPVPG
jgi:hypothetical protein